MAIIYRTPGVWGAGQGSNLSAAQIDENFWQLFEDIQSLTAGQTAAIDYFNIVGNQLFVHMTDHEVLGPYTIPTAQWNWTGAWQPDTPYNPMDVFSYEDGLYLVVTQAISPTTWDWPNINYRLLFQAQQGIQGHRGPPGFGEDGEDGNIGPQGSRGSASTVPGPTGSIGLTGATGPSGPTGPAGAASTVPGPRGLRGYGQAGEDGEDGGPGPPGRRGNAGLVGGASTVPGPRGFRGFPVSPAEDGEDGAQGPPGRRGPVGTAGATGATGSGGASFSGMVAGNYYVPFLSKVGSVFLSEAITTFLFVPFLALETCTIDKLGLSNAGGSSGTVAFALYASTNGVPTGAPLATTGNVAVASGNIYGTLGTSYQVQAGTLYWIGMAISATGNDFVNGIHDLFIYLVGTSGTTLFGYNLTPPYGYSSTGQTYGTWPTTPSVTPSNSVPFISYHVVSVP